MSELSEKNEGASPIKAGGKEGKPKKAKKKKAASVKYEKLYKSNWMPDKLTLPQLMAERMCERRAAWLREKLSARFWLDGGDWEKEFKYQIGQANGLLKKWPQMAVTEAIAQEKWCFSLRNPKLLKTIESKARALKTIAETIYPEPEVSNSDDSLPGPQLPDVGEKFVSGKSVVDRLKEME